jgi:hypothetical protein
MNGSRVSMKEFDNFSFTFFGAFGILVSSQQTLACMVDLAEAEPWETILSKALRSLSERQTCHCAT